MVVVCVFPCYEGSIRVVGFSRPIERLQVACMQAPSTSRIKPLPECMCCVPMKQMRRITYLANHLQYEHMTRYSNLDSASWQAGYDIVAAVIHM